MISSAYASILSYLPSLSSIVMTALAGFNMAAGSTDIRVTWIVSELSRTVSPSIGIATISDDVVALNISSLLVAL